MTRVIVRTAVAGKFEVIVLQLRRGIEMVAPFSGHTDFLRLEILHRR